MMYGKERANNESKRQTLNEFLHSLKGEFISLLSWNENFDATLNQEMKSLEPKIQEKMGFLQNMIDHMSYVVHSLVGRITKFSQEKVEGLLRASNTSQTLVTEPLQELEMRNNSAERPYNQLYIPEKQTLYPKFAFESYRHPYSINKNYEPPLSGSYTRSNRHNQSLDTVDRLNSQNSMF